MKFSLDTVKMLAEGKFIGIPVKQESPGASFRGECQTLLALVALHMVEQRHFLRRTWKRIFKA
jgi:hypothetical protein